MFILKEKKTRNELYSRFIDIQRQKDYNSKTFFKKIKVI